MKPRGTQQQDGGGDGVQVLWAPWRMRYIEEEKTTSECIFCSSAAPEAQRHNLILAVSPHARVLLNKYPYNNGHLLVAPGRHTALLAELPEHEYNDLMVLLRYSLTVVEAALHPQGVNIGLNLGACAGAGIVDHLHWHIVPRWHGDTNFMPVIGEVKVMPQHLMESYDQLRPFFAAAPQTERKGSDPR
jgi:ATP adenylyltransferase